MDYFNDHERIVRSAHIEQLIDRFYRRAGRDCTDPETRAAMRDVLSVIDAIKLCGRNAHAGLIKLASFCATFTPQQFALFFHVIGGGTLIQYAIGEGITEQAAYREQMAALVGTIGCVGAEGQVDVTKLRKAIVAGFETAGKLDVLGGLLTFDKEDADGLFDFIGRQ